MVGPTAEGSDGPLFFRRLGTGTCRARHRHGHWMIGRCTFNAVMAFLDGQSRTLAQAISTLAYCNPFLPERIEGERAALGSDFVASGTLWHVKGEPEPTPNLNLLELRGLPPRSPPAG